MPLAVYREVEAHLRMVEGIDAGLQPQQSQTFEYLQSQVGGVWIEAEPQKNALCWAQVVQVLLYYQSRYSLRETKVLDELRELAKPKTSEQH